jgi:hypothetical protein
MKGITPKSDVLVRRMGQEAVLLNLKTETYYMLNSTGIRMWELLSNGSSVDDTVSTLSAEYQVSPDTLRADLTELIQQLNAAQLIDILD